MKNNCFSRKSDCLFDFYFLIVSASGNQRLQHIQSDFGRHLGRCMTFTSTSGNLIRPWMMVRLQKDKRSWWFKAYFPNGKPTTWASSLGICWIFIHFLLGFLSKSESWSSLRVPFSVFVDGCLESSESIYSIRTFRTTHLGNMQLPACMSWCFLIFRHIHHPIFGASDFELLD